ncbi:glycosyltransferase family 4 protein, partial [Candidatus Micrarchaeota archaeon]|nr:glycosyltransferase family 4 protein [Candidatus Micrarchaeota archaeon]
MKIVQVTHHFSPCIGGVESVVLETSRRLVEAGHEVSVVCLDRCAKGGKILPGTGEIDGIKITRIPFIDLKYYKIAPRVLSLITGADLVHVHGVGFFSDYLLALKGVHKLPVIVSTHGGIMHTRKMRVIKAIYGLWMPLMLNRADAVVAVSKNDRDAFSRICAGGKVRLIENGIDYARFANARWKTEKNSFIYVGRLSRNKRVDNLIETFAFLKKAGVEFKLTILGHDFDGIAEKLHGLVEKKGLGGDVMFV